MPKPEAERRVRLLYLTGPAANFAGIERVAHEVCAQLAAQYGDVLDVHVGYCTRFPEVAEAAPPYTVHYLDAPRLLSLFRPLAGLLARVSFDIIIVAQCEPAVIAWLAMRLRGSRALLVPHLHGNPMIEEASSPKARLTFFLFRTFVAPRTAALLAVSPSLAAHARAAGLAAKRPVYCLMNPVRNLGAEPARAAGPLFACVARLAYQKGQDILLRAFARVLAAEPAARLALVGSGPKEEELRKLATDLGLGAAVTFHGHVADPAPLLKTAACFVLASRWEGFGVVLVEALGLGLPLVVADCPFGPSDIVNDPRLGKLVPVEDVDALADAMVQTLREPAPADAVAFRQARAREFSSDKVARNGFAVLQEIVRGSGQRGEGRFARLLAHPREAADVPSC